MIRTFVRYGLATAAGALSGLVWGIQVAMFQPTFVEELPHNTVTDVIVCVVLLAPILIVALCSRYLAWWTRTVQAVFTAALLISGLGYDAYNVTRVPEDVNWSWSFVIGMIWGAVSVGTWAIARTIRYRAVRHQADREHTMTPVE